MVLVYLSKVKTTIKKKRLSRPNLKKNKFPSYDFGLLKNKAILNTVKTVFLCRRASNKIFNIFAEMNFWLLSDPKKSVDFFLSGM